MLFPTRYVVYDLETTGLNPSRDEAVEIGALKVTEEGAESRTWLLKASVPICEEAAQITGITQEEIARDGREPTECWKEFMEFTGIGGDTPLCVVGHNIVRFDNLFVENAITKMEKSLGRHEFCDTAAIYKGAKLKSLPFHGESGRAYASRILSMRVAGLGYKLLNVYQEFGGSMEGLKAHRVQADVHMTNFVYRKLASFQH
ncbi:3'-5' exonuclease [Candidatus Parcubacteria bacterium]|nr:3'-5' exonuclease [Candidatus Parcubacteria bacterium]